MPCFAVPAARVTIAQPFIFQEIRVSEPFPGTSPTESPPRNRLDSWKEIAAYLKRDITTVQRWEKRDGMPVHPHLHDRLPSLYPFPSQPDTFPLTPSLPL